MIRVAAILAAWCLLAGTVRAELDVEYLLQDDAANTTIADSSGNGRDNTLVGAGNTSASSVSGPGNTLTKAITFDGVDDKINGASGTYDAAEIGITNVASIAAWVRCTDSSPANPVVVAKTGASTKGLGIWIYDGKVYGGFNTSDTNYSINSAISEGVWTHVEWTRDGTEMRLYVNGVEAASDLATNAGNMDGSGTLGIAHVGGDNMRQHLQTQTFDYYEGDLAAVKFYDTEQTPAEVTANYNEGVTPPRPVMVLRSAVAPPATNDIGMTLERVDGGSGAVTVSQGVIFQEGDLTEAQEAADQLQVWVNGVEQACYVESLDGRWPDGSIKSCLVQFDYTWSGSVSGEVRIGAARNTTDIAKQTIPKEPDAFFFPTSTTYLCNAFPLWYDIIPKSQHPTAPDSFGTILDTVHTEYEDNSDTIWATVDAAVDGDAGSGTDGNDTDDKWKLANSSASYDRPRHEYQYFCMTADVEHLERSIKHCYYYADGYATGNNWTLPAWHGVPLQGVVIAYWLTGDDEYRYAAFEMLDGWRSSLNDLDTLMEDNPDGDGNFVGLRMPHNLFQAACICHHLGQQDANQAQSLHEYGQDSGATTNAELARLFVDEARRQQTYVDNGGERDDVELGHKELALTGRSGTFQKGETITAPSGASDPIRQLLTNDLLEVRSNIASGTEFAASDVITGSTSGATATVSTVSGMDGGSQPWMTGLFASAAECYTQWVSTDRDATIKTMLEEDYAWTETVWVTADKAWHIYDLDAAEDNLLSGVDGRGELNAYPLALMAYLMTVETDGPTKAGYKTRGDDAVDAISQESGNWNNAKQSNQMNWGLWQWIAERNN